jgi:hypothetical protein
VTVNVDKARRDHTARGVEDPSRSPRDVADGDNSVAPNRDIGPARGRPASVNNKATANHEVRHARTIAGVPRRGQLACHPRQARGSLRR